MIALPIDPFIPQIIDDVRRARAAVVVASPGAGKTTRLPPALIDDGPVILLQPRRVAARAIASRIAQERSWTVGGEVGWQIRYEKTFTAATRLLVVTEGILTARLQSDPLLSDFRTIVLDEFHERSIHADVAIALARQAWHARSDLRIVVMSATIDASAVSAYLDGCPVIDVPGRVHPLDIAYAPGESVADAVEHVLSATAGNVLCFMPGAAEINRTIAAIARRDVDVLPLYGSMSGDEQDAALRPAARRRVIVATNIAETSLTVPGVTAVVDSGLHKVARYDADRAIDSLETERITADSAAQRAGRAGRIGPGVVRRLWDARDRLRLHREAEIHRVDLSAPALDVFAWGGDPRTLDWFEAPDAAALDAALTLLARLELVQQGRLTALGERVRRLPLHPRLARMLVAANGTRDIVRACALLSERHLIPPRTASTTSDLLSALDRWNELPQHVRSAVGSLQSTAGGLQSGVGSLQSGVGSLQSAVGSLPSELGTEDGIRRAVLAGYPDRIAQRRAPGSDAFLLASGTGARLGRESGVREGDFIAVHDVTNGIIRMATRIEREWLTPTSSETVHRFDAGSGRVRAARIDRYDALVLGEHPVAVDPDAAAALLAQAWHERGPRDADRTLLRRLAFAGLAVDVDALVQASAVAARSLDDIDIASQLTAPTKRDVDRLAPERLTVPSGRSHAITYHDDGSASVSVKLQELFGLAETPRIGPRRTPIRIELLAPNGRPVQVTQDLRSFWDRTYPEVRKELRGRYPKHPWPENPWSATPSARTKRRGP